MRRLVVLGLGFAHELTAGGDDFGSTGDDIGHLEAEAGPGALPFAAAVNADDAIADRDLADDFVLLQHGAAEDLLVEVQGATHVRCPDDVFEAFDFHVRYVPRSVRGG